MSEFTIHTVDSAPEGSKDLLASAQRNYGFVPNLLGVMAGAPTNLESYLMLGQALGETTFTPVEQQVVALTVSRLNECTYCMAAHSGIAKMAGMSDADLAALRAGAPLDDARLEALATFVAAVVTERGRVSRIDQEAFLAAGFSQPQILEALVGVTMKTLSNYTNHIAETPLDAQFKGFEWSPPVPEFQGV